MLEGIDAARRSFRQHQWEEAVAAFGEQDRTHSLEPDDLVQYAAAAWWSGDVDTATDALERAYGGFELAGQAAEAAVVALRLARMALAGLRISVMGGWIARAERLLQGQPESGAHAWLNLMSGAAVGLIEGDLDRGVLTLDTALRQARTHGNPDVESLALAIKGQLLLRRGEWRAGLALIEEAAAAASSVRLEPVNSCDVYCVTIASFSGLGEYGRAGEWIDEADRWMRRQSISGYRGVCRVHLAELKRMQGDWPGAENEARLACRELESFRMLESVGFAHYEIGEVRLHLGDLDEAGAAFQRALEYGHPAQPGMALLALAQGKRREAADMIAAALTDAAAGGQNANLLTRARLLAAQVEIALAREDLATANRASEDLQQLDSEYDCDVVHGLADSVAGAVALREGRLPEAVAVLRRGTQAWKAARVPYEWARSRALLGRGLLAAGDRTSGRLELRAARGEFERLGAVAELAEVDALLHGGDDQDAAGVTKTFMFTDIVSSTDLAGSLGDSTWRGVMAWHDRTLRAAFARHGGTEVRHTGDGFFVTFDGAQEALACAVEIQRQLEANRREHGAALTVRIGLHLTSALRHEDDYAGQGVHVAARVTALGGRGEIVASRSVVEAAEGSGFDFTQPRKENVKGVTEPVVVQNVRWT